MAKRKCTVCKHNLELTRDNFHYKNKKKRTFQYTCIECWKTKHHEHYEANKQAYIDKAAESRARLRPERIKWLFEYFKLHPCVDCGATDPRILEFDHVRGKKLYNVGRIMQAHSLKVILKEIAKCVVRCANCHRIRTAAQFNWYAGVVIEAARPASTR